VATEADETLIRRLKEANGGRLADVVIICFDGFIPLALKSVERGGTVLFFAGAAENATLPSTINELFWRTEITLTSSYGGGPVDCSEALTLIGAGSLPLERMITHRLSLEEGPEGFRTVCSPTTHDCVKVIVKPAQT
jgi:L-iditol 2-dehydrogenase